MNGREKGSLFWKIAAVLFLLWLFLSFWGSRYYYSLEDVKPFSQQKTQRPQPGPPTPGEFSFLEGITPLGEEPEKRETLVRINKFTGTVSVYEEGKWNPWE
jgi:hypothetical protein